MPSVSEKELLETVARMEARLGARRDVSDLMARYRELVPRFEDDLAADARDIALAKASALMLVQASLKAPAFRPLAAADQPKIWHWLHIALWDPPPATLRPIEVLQSPHVRIYAEGWGREGDVGVVAQVDGVDAGACWMRLLPEGVGLAWVDARTPQLGIALEPAFQHKGYGRPLMLAALDAARGAGYQKVSLTVHPENPAIGMYESCGFRKVELRGTYHLMVVTFARP
jgi:ribosomal protein S18 acetylase RimI-like enzyme